MLYLSLLLGLPIFDARGRRVGVVGDLSADFRPLFPKVLALGISRQGKTAFFIPWGLVAAVSARGIKLSVPEGELTPVEPVEGERRLRRELLDRQIVDRHGRKVVRVNDVALAHAGGDLRLVAVDAGMRGVLRRLNWEGAFLATARLVRARPPDTLIPWNYVEPLERWGEVRLRISQRRLAELPATDLAKIMEDLDTAGRSVLLDTLDDETLADALPRMDEDVQVEVMHTLDEERASDILERMPPDEAADLLRDLPDEKADDLLEGMETEEAEDVRDLLQYPEDTAGGIMTTEYVALPGEATVDEAIARLRAMAPSAETAYYLYVIDADGKLEGVLPVRRLLTCPAGRRVDEVMDTDVVRVSVRDDQERVARLMSRYHFVALPVVDDEERLAGIVTMDDALDVLRQETDQDLTRAAGTAFEVEPDTSAALESAWRLPWLLAFVALGTVVALGTSEYLRAGRLTWDGAAFLPAIIALSTLVGTQSGTAALRSLSLGELGLAGFGRQAALELLSGLLSGIVVGLVAAGLALAWRAPVVALALVLGLPLAGIAATVVGLLLPLALSKLRVDPTLALRPAMALTALLTGVPVYLWLVGR